MFYFSQQKKFEDTVNINYRLPIKVYYRICTLRHIRIEINHGSQNAFLFQHGLADTSKLYPSLLARDKILFSDVLVASRILIG